MLILHLFCMSGDCGVRLRYGEIQKKLDGINTRILSERLSMLEKEGLIKRTVENTKPIAIWYEVTDKAKDLKGMCEFLTEWTKKWEKK